MLLNAGRNYYDANVVVIPVLRSAGALPMSGRVAAAAPATAAVAAPASASAAAAVAFAGGVGRDGGYGHRQVRVVGRLVVAAGAAAVFGTHVRLLGLVLFMGCQWWVAAGAVAFRSGSARNVSRQPVAQKW